MRNSTRDGQSMALRRYRTPVALAVFAAAISVLLNPGYDEAFWLGVTRLMERGRVLYEGAIDNKTPPVYGLVWLLDSAPGQFQVARGILVGTALFFATVGLRRLGGGQDHADLTAAVGGGVIALASDLRLTVELLAVVSLIGALDCAIRGRWLGASALAFVMASLDPRTIVFFPAIVLAQPGSRSRRATAVVLSSMVASATLVVLLNTRLRYGLFELAIASRPDASEWHGARVALAIAITFLPFAVLLRYWRLRPVNVTASAAALAVGVVGVGLASLFPFAHYWLYGVPSIVVLIDEPRVVWSQTGRIRAIVLSLAFTPSVVGTAGSLLADQHYWQAYSAAASEVSDSERAVPLGLRPQLGAQISQVNILRSPAIEYLVWDTSRRERYLEELPEVLEDASTILEYGIVSRPVDEILPELRTVRQTVTQQLDEFPCVREVGVVTVWRREGWCQPVHE